MSERVRRRRRDPVGSPLHPLADVARRRCRELHPSSRSAVACGECWERVIRDDERVVILFRLPREVPQPDPDDVDEIAVELAIAGQRPALTPVELVVAIERLAPRRWSDREIAEWLGVRVAEVVNARAEVSSDAEVA